MSSKLLTTVLAVIIVGPFTYMSTADAVSIKHHLQSQHEHIQTLKTEYTKLDTQLGKTQETKKQTQAQIDQLEHQAQSFATERQKLESELGAN